MPRMLNYYVELVNLMVKNNRSQNMSQAKLQKYLKQCLFPVHSGVHVFLSKWSSGSCPFLLGKPRLVSGKIRTFSQFCRWNCQMLPFFQGAHGLNSLNIPKNPWDVELQGSCWEILGVWKFIFFIICWRIQQNIHKQWTKSPRLSIFGCGLLVAGIQGISLRCHGIWDGREPERSRWRLPAVVASCWGKTWGHFLSLSGWWFQPLWKILVSWDDYSQYMEK